MHPVAPAGAGTPDEPDVPDAPATAPAFLAARRARVRPPESVLGFIRSLRSYHFEVAFRAALAVALPLIVLAGLGRIDWAAYAAFGAMTALYGRNEPYSTRLRTVSVAGALMLAIIAFGLLLAVVQAPLWVLTGGLLLVIVVSILVASTAGLFPATAIFFVFGYAVVAQIPTAAGDVWPRLLVAVLAAGFAWLLTLSGALLRRAAGERTPALFKNLLRTAVAYPGAYRDPQVWLTIVQNVLGALAAGALALSLGFGHPYWAVVAVIAVLPPPRGAHSVARAVHRIVGTTVGVGISAAILLPGPPVWVLILVIGVGQFGAEIFIGRHYGVALLFVTPLALSVVHLVSVVPVENLLIDRVLETTLGGLVALVIVLMVRGLQSRRRRRHPFTEPAG